MQRLNKNFNCLWEEEFMFVQNEYGEALCIICNKILTVLTKYNLQRQYNLYHIEKYGNVTGENRKECIKKLKELVFESVAMLLC